MKIYKAPDGTAYYIPSKSFMPYAAVRRSSYVFPGRLSIIAQFARDTNERSAVLYPDQITLATKDTTHNVLFGALNEVGKEDEDL